jgi:hypothetical protein
METGKHKLIEKALNQYKMIKPCSCKSSLEECFTQTNDIQYLWFNTEDNSTRVVSENSIPPVRE